MEFALILPLFLLLVFGIVEFGWAWSQQLDLRHGAREGARLAAVNYGEDEAAQTDALVAEACDRMDGVDGAALTVSFPDGDDAGDEVTVAIEADLQTLTGFLDFALGDVELRSEVSIRLEQDATFSAVSDRVCP